MRKLIHQYYISFLTVLFLFLISCTPESCFEETEAPVKASFYIDGTTTISAPDSLTIYGINMESNKLYNKSLKVNTALLPLDASTGYCVYVIIINGITDTLEFSYNSYPHLISKECGYTFYHNIDQPDHTSNIIKGIYLNKSNITTLNEENIRIFY